MLTKIDLGQIKTIVKEEVSSIVEVKLETKLKPIKRDLKKIRKDLKFAVGQLDRERWQLEKRFDSHAAVTA